MPITLEKSGRPLRAIAAACENMPVASQRIILSRLSHVYGELKGQRAVNLDELEHCFGHKMTPSKTFNAIVALEAYFFLVCGLFAISAYQQNAHRFITNLRSLSVKDFRSFLRRLISGDLLAEEGVLGSAHAFDFAWVAESCTHDGMADLRDSLADLCESWDERYLRIAGLDPLQSIHHSLFPKNLLHTTGQFYTPQWLAALLLDDLNWTYDQRLLDPFCGSGVFLVSALDKATRAGVDPSDVLPRIVGIDLNPTASAAARANLAIYLSQFSRTSRPFHLNILSGDTLLPAVADANRHNPDSLFPTTISIDGETVDGFEHEAVSAASVVGKLTHYGLDLRAWLPSQVDSYTSAARHTTSARDRRVLEQLFVGAMRPADVLVTNPPWIGWEYIPRPYRDTLNAAWMHYDLFKVRGLDAAFLKEDISTLALVVAWARYLDRTGRSAVVLRPSTMHSSLAARGLRRLSLYDNTSPIRLDLIRTFVDLRVFSGANTEAATWQITRDQPTAFPIPVIEWRRSVRRWKPQACERLEDVLPNVTIANKHANRTEPEDPESRWLVSGAETASSLAAIQGSNEYVPRMGVFTGGANAVFYVECIGPVTQSTAMYRNITERAKRKVRPVSVSLEPDIVYSVVRGRDIQMWTYSTEAFLVCPHTVETKMYPLTEPFMQEHFPLAYEYLCSMRPELTARQGFAGWEKSIHQEHFYTLQRIGEYTFAPFKVCWKYIASEFTVCVVGQDDRGRPILPNDKVMFVPFADAKPAYFLAGVLSMSLVRQYVNACANKRQISTNVIRSLSIPPFDRLSRLHRRIGDVCREGHRATTLADVEGLAAVRQELGELSGALFPQPVHVKPSTRSLRRKQSPSSQLRLGPNL